MFGFAISGLCALNCPLPAPFSAEGCPCRSGLQLCGVTQAVWAHQFSLCLPETALTHLAFSRQRKKPFRILGLWLAAVTVNRSTPYRPRAETLVLLEACQRSCTGSIPRPSENRSEAEFPYITGEILTHANEKTAHQLLPFYYASRGSGRRARVHFAPL